MYLKPQLVIKNCYQLGLILGNSQYTTIAPKDLTAEVLRPGPEARASLPCECKNQSCCLMLMTDEH